MVKPPGKARWQLLEAGDHLICDSASWHTSADVRLVLDDYDVKPHIIPGALGKWLNACDQAINREFRRNFLKLKEDRTHHSKIRNIIAAYYGIKETTILNSIRHTGVTRRVSPQDILQARVEEGYCAPKERAADFDRYKVAYINWCMQMRIADKDVLPENKPKILHSTPTVGRYWREWGH